MITHVVPLQAPASVEPGAPVLCDPCAAAGLQIQINGTFDATYNFEGSLDGENWTLQTLVDSGSGSPVTSATAASRAYSNPGTTPKYFRLNCVAWVSGEPTAVAAVTNSRGE